MSSKKWYCRGWELQWSSLVKLFASACHWNDNLTACAAAYSSYWCFVDGAQEATSRRATSNYQLYKLGSSWLEICYVPSIERAHTPTPTCADSLVYDYMAWIQCLKLQAVSKNLGKLPESHIWKYFHWDAPFLIITFRKNASDSTSHGFLAQKLISWDAQGGEKK